MKIKPAQADRFAAAPPEGLRAVLLYGPDAGLVRERSNILARTVVADLADPFRVAELVDSDVRKDPARLSDEAAAIAMMGGRRIVRIRPAGDGVAPAIKSFLADPVGDALILVEAGELGPRSALRRAFEEEKTLAAALPCYVDDARALETVIADTLARAGLEPEPAALAFLLDHLGSDRGVTMRELEKLCLYMGADIAGDDTARRTRRPVSLDDVQASVGDTAAVSLDALVDATAGGDLARVDANLTKLREADANAVSILAALARHLQRLHVAAGRIEAGADLGAAVRALRPPVHFSREPSLKRQIGLWSRRRLQRALALVAQAEADCKTTGMPAMALCGQALIRIAQAARAGAQRAR